MSWTDVKTALPEKFKRVLLRGLIRNLPMSGDTVVHYEGYLTGTGDWSDWSGEVDSGVEITHWMPLPEPPTQR
jgi:hypothetical protein